MVAERDVKVGDLLVKYNEGTPAVVLEITEDLQIRGYDQRPHPRKQYRLWTEGRDIWIKEFSLNVQYYRACGP